MQSRFNANHHDNSKPFDYDGPGLEAHPDELAFHSRSGRSCACGVGVGRTSVLAGVEIGSVKSVRARPEMKEAPAEVVTELTPSYELKIPNDSIASLATAGVLGETYVEIDAAHASCAPIGTKPKPS